MSEDVENLSGDAREKLSAFIDRIENLEERKSGVNEDLKLVYAEAKATGFDTKILRRVIRLRRVDRARRDEEEQLVQLYLDSSESI